MTNVLTKELETYEANLDALIAAHDTKFVVIYGDEVLGTFDTHMDGIASGYREYGNVPFLVKHIAKDDMPLSFVSNLLGI